jgi:hypothetical protein
VLKVAIYYSAVSKSSQNSDHWRSNWKRSFSTLLLD